MTSPARGLSPPGKHSSIPSANSGTHHSGGGCPATPLNSITIWMVARTRRRALANSTKASGSSTSSAEMILVVKSLEP